jgi:asparagine synthase (glutamine-hydrolysing)
VCGIAGQLRLSDRAGEIAPAVADAMLARLAHRGPDGRGQWRSSDRRCWLGHTRLAIIDLATGAQPMTTEDGLAITFNGEIYNFRELRAELEREGERFRTQSDTEAILLGYRRWGGAALLGRLQGLFAFAIYDARSQSLLLARDHAGVKPLFWCRAGDELLFASEMKSLLAHPAVGARRRVNEAGIAQLVVTRTVARPQTLLDGVMRLPEGHAMRASVARGIEPAEAYWDLEPQPRPIGEDEALGDLERRLKEVVAQQLVADVPVGVQLSGGVHSSLVAALMDTIRRERGERHAVRSFSIGFDIAAFSELPYAKRVAERYATEHREIVIGANDFVDDFARLAWFHDEPMGEPSAVPTYYMCRRAKPHVSVMLCGEGADERFGGYSKYSFEALATRLAFLPDALRLKALRAVAGALPFRARRVAALLEVAAIPSQALRFASWSGGFDAVQARQVLHERFRQRHGDGGLEAAFEAILSGCNGADTLERFGYCDGHARLVDDMLVKGDRMSMATGVEARVPFLDHRLAEFSARLPASLKIKGFERKHLLKKLAEKYLPREVIYRRKVGFTVPLTRWFTGPLAPLVRGLLLSSRALDRGYFDREALRAVIDGHVQRRTDREQAIWVLLALEIWHRLFIDDDGSPQAIERVQAQLMVAA